VLNAQLGPAAHTAKNSARIRWRTAAQAAAERRITRQETSASPRAAGAAILVLEMFLEIPFQDVADCVLNPGIGRHGLAAHNPAGDYLGATLPNLERENKPCCNYLATGVSVGNVRETFFHQ
jgi:hypothetical protein